MSYKNIISYGLAILTGVILTLGITFLKKDVHEAHAEHEEHSQGHQHSHEHEEDHNENKVVLSAEQIQKIGLKFAAAGPGEVLQMLSTRGKIVIQPDKLAHIIPKVSGVALRADKNIGNYVQVNELMAVLESREMADIKAAYLSALSQYQLAMLGLQREKKLYEEKVSASEDYLKAKNIYEEAKINVQLGQQKLKAFGLSESDIQQLADQDDPDLRIYQIRSPLDGTVIMRHITIGEAVENTTTIYEIANLETVWVEIGIYPKDLSLIKKNQKVEVMLPTASQGETARLIYVSQIISDETITAKAIAALDNAEGLWQPGTFVKVDIALDTFSFPIVIPLDAVQNSEGKDFIFIVTPDGFEKRNVKLGMHDAVNVQIVSGLDAGEQFVINKTFILKADLGKSSAAHEH